jgi:hypothetical protein
MFKCAFFDASFIQYFICGVSELKWGVRSVPNDVDRTAD